MLFLSSGTVDATLKSTPISQQGRTVYHISVILKETQGDATVSKQGMGWVTHTLVENCQPRGEIISIVPMENSPRLGRARQAPDRWPSLSCTGRAGRRREEVVVEENEEELEEVEGKMKNNRFSKQPSRNSGNSSQKGRDLVELAAQTETQDKHIRSSTLRSVTFRAKGLVFGQHGTVSGHSSLPRAVLRRPCQDEALVGRRVVSMYGDPTKQQKDSQSEQERPLPRPRSVRMLADPALSEAQTQQPLRRGYTLENNQQARSRKADLRAVDGLSSFVAQRPLVPAEVTPRVRQRSLKPRPVSMTVLELRKRGSDDEIDSQRNCSHTGNDGGSFLKGSFRWRLFGKANQDKSKEKEGDKDLKSSPKSSKSDASKSTLSTLRRSFSLRIRRTRPRDKVTLGSDGDSNECSLTKSTVVETSVPPRPFSYLTGRALPTSNEKTEEGGMQYIQYHSKGKVKVMEVPLCPAKLSSKPVQEEPSIWQLIANRFRRKEQPYSCKCESQQSQSKDTSQYPLPENNKSQPVTIETLTGIDSQKGQGKTSRIAEFISQLSSPFIAPFSLHRKLQSKRNTEVCFFF